MAILYCLIIVTVIITNNNNRYINNTHTHTHNRLTAFGPGLPGTRKNIHQLTPILIIGHPLSSSSIYNDPWHPLCSLFILSSTFRTLSSFPNCFSNLLIPPPCFLVSAWTFCHSTYVLSCFHHYTFHLLPVIIYTQAFPICLLYLNSDHASVLLTCLFLLQLPYTHSWLELPTPTFCC